MNPPYLSLTASQALQLPCAKIYSLLLALKILLKLRLRHEGKYPFLEKYIFASSCWKNYLSVLTAQRDVKGYETWTCHTKTQYPKGCFAHYRAK